MVLAAASIEKAGPGMGRMEAALLTDMEKRIEYYQRLAANLEEKINSLQKSAARRPATPLFGSNEINPDFLKNLGVRQSTAKQVEIYRKELATLESLLGSMETAEKDMETLGGIPKDARMADGTFNGYHPKVQKALEIAALFSATDAYADAATWKLAAAQNLEQKISREGSARFTSAEISDIAARGTAYLGVLRRQMEKLSEKGGAKEDYTDAKDVKGLEEKFGQVQGLLAQAKEAAGRRNIGNAGALVRKAAKLQLETDETYNKVMTEALNKRHVYEEGNWYDRFKYKTAPVGDVVAAAAPVALGLLGAGFGGLHGGLAGAKAGADFSAFWWYYRGVDGVATAAANGRAFSLECAESIGLALLSASHIPAAGSFRWLKPAGQAMGYGLAGSMAYHAGSELADAWRRDWFLTSGQRKQFIFYGAVITFSAAGIAPMKIADKKLAPGFEAFRETIREGDLRGIVSNKDAWAKLVDYLKTAGDRETAKTVKTLMDAADARLNRPLSRKFVGGRRMTNAIEPKSLETALSILDGTLGGLKKLMDERIAKETKAMTPRQRNLLSDSLAYEYSMGVKELPLAAEVVDKGLYDLRAGRASAESLVYISFEKTAKEMERLGFSRQLSSTIGLLAVAADAKFYCAPGHQMRVHELTGFIMESFGERPPASIMHDIGKAFFSTAMLSAEEGSFAHKFGKRGRIIGLSEGHTVAGLLILERISALEPEAYAKSGQQLIYGVDHHQHTSLGASALSKATSMFADQLDAMYSMRAYKQGVVRPRDLLDDAREFLKGRQYTYGQLAKLGIKLERMIPPLREFNRRFDPELDALFGRERTAINERTLEETARRVDALIPIPRSGEHFRNLVSAYIIAQAGSTERVLLEHAIGNIMYDTGRRITGHPSFAR